MFKRRCGFEGIASRLGQPSCFDTVKRKEQTRCTMIKVQCELLMAGARRIQQCTRTLYVYRYSTWYSFLYPEMMPPLPSSFWISTVKERWTSQRASERVIIIQSRFSQPQKLGYYRMIADISYYQVYEHALYL